VTKTCPLFVFSVRQCVSETTGKYKLMTVQLKLSNSVFEQLLLRRMLRGSRHITLHSASTVTLKKVGMDFPFRLHIN
jgi:hypothetical protein